MMDTQKMYKVVWENHETGETGEGEPFPAKERHAMIKYCAERTEAESHLGITYKVVEVERQA